MPTPPPPAPPLATLAVDDLEAPALHHGTAHGLEKSAGHPPPRGADQLDPPRDLPRLGRVGAQHAGQLVEHGLQMPAQDAVLVQAGQQLVHGQQRMQFLLAEPDPRQLMLR
jgi:hypothetical protein